MARHKQYDPIETEHAQLDISSLIDVTFLLLIYFLVTSAIQLRETDLRLDLPVTPRTVIHPIDSLLVQVAGDGQVSVGAGAALEMLDSDPASRDLPLLDQRLELYAAAARGAGSQPLVQVRVDDDVPQQRVIDVINAFARKEIQSITFTDL
jgi:biopolymer transport protein ExbD